MIPELSPASPIRSIAPKESSLAVSLLKDPSLEISNSQTGTSFRIEEFNYDPLEGGAPIQALNFEYEADRVEARTFLEATAEFIGDASHIKDGTDWEGKYGIEVSAITPDSRGDDEKYFEQNAPLDLTPLFVLEGTTHDPEKSRGINITAGSNSCQEFNLRKAEGRAIVTVKVAPSEFKEVDDLVERTQRFFAHLDPDLENAQLGHVIELFKALDEITEAN